MWGGSKEEIEPEGQRQRRSPRVPIRRWIPLDSGFLFASYRCDVLVARKVAPRI
jgi:hypothetical protein